MGAHAHTEARDEAYLATLDEAVGIADRAGIPYGLIGSIASTVQGNPHPVGGGEDIDVFIRWEDADDLLERFERAGYETERTNDRWIYKAKKGVVVDLIFRTMGDIYLDEEMAARIRRASFRGRDVPLIPPEDVTVMKAVAHGADTPTYWHDALGIVARGALDWDYLIHRSSQHGARRILSLLLYAQSDDIPVPGDVVERLWDVVRRAS